VDKGVTTSKTPPGNATDTNASSNKDNWGTHSCG